MLQNVLRTLNVGYKCYLSLSFTESRDCQNYLLKENMVQVINTYYATIMCQPGNKRMIKMAFTTSKIFTESISKIDICNTNII